LPDNVSRCHIWNGDGHEMPIGLSLLREGLCEVEGEAFRKYSSLLGRVFLLGWLGLRRGRRSLGACLAFGRSRRRRLRGCQHHRDGANMSLAASRARILSSRWSSKDWKPSRRLWRSGDGEQDILK